MAASMSDSTAADVTPAMTASPAGQKYTVKKGDTLWKISARHYGNPKEWKKIAEANPKINPNKLKAGQVIVIP
jgi:5'-nucleotidase